MCGAPAYRNQRRDGGSLLKRAWSIGVVALPSVAVSGSVDRYERLGLFKVRRRSRAGGQPTRFEFSLFRLYRHDKRTAHGISIRGFASFASP